MPLVYYDTDKLKKLSDVELLIKQQELESKISKAQVCSVSSEIMEQYMLFNEYYTAEIDRRVEMDELDLDEVEEEVAEVLKQRKLEAFKKEKEERIKREQEAEKYKLW